MPALDFIPTGVSPLGWDSPVLKQGASGNQHPEAQAPFQTCLPRSSLDTACQSEPQRHLLEPRTLTPLHIRPLPRSTACTLRLVLRGKPQVCRALHPRPSASASRCLPAVVRLCTLEITDSNAEETLLPDRHTVCQPHRTALPFPHQKKSLSPPLCALASRSPINGLFLHLL